MPDRCIHIDCERPPLEGEYDCAVHRAWCKLLADDIYRYTKPPTVEEMLAGAVPSQGSLL